MFILKAYSTSADLQQGMKELHGMLSDFFFFLLSFALQPSEFSRPFREVQHSLETKTIALEPDQQRIQAIKVAFVRLDCSLVPLTDLASSLLPIGSVPLHLDCCKARLEKQEGF